MKKIAVLTLGSRGDIQPFIALSLALQGAGFDIRLITYSKFRRLIDSYGIDFVPIKDSYEKALVDILSSPENPFTVTRRIEDAISPVLDKVLLDSWHSCKGADAIVSAGTSFWGFDIAKKLKIPHILVGLIPLRPTSEFPHCASSLPNINGFLNRLSGKLVSRILWAGYSNSINRWREQSLNFSPWTSVPFETKEWCNQLELLAYSPTLLPQPKDWPANVHTTGFWFLDEPAQFRPDQALLQFLSEGSTPVYVGFGSMEISESKKNSLATLFSNALKRSGQRGIFCGELGRGNHDCNHIFCIDSVNHSWLLPQTSLVIHHGGVGTTGAALRSGRPSIVVPFFSDQPFWGDRLLSLGASAGSFRKSTLVEDVLVDAIGRTLRGSKTFSEAQALSTVITSENGLGRAVSLISKYIQ